MPSCGQATVARILMLERKHLQQHQGHIGITEKKLETTIGFRV